MIAKIQIIEKIKPFLAQQGCFLVDAKVSKDNDITLIIDRPDAEVDLNTCVAVSRYFETCYNRDEEDYSLTVTSSGLDGEFLVVEQYLKYKGKKVEVSLKGGRKIVATLNEVTLDADKVESINISYTTLIPVPGSKKKQTTTITETVEKENINIVKPYIEF